MKKGHNLYFFPQYALCLYQYNKNIYFKKCKKVLYTSYKSGFTFSWPQLWCKPSSLCQTPQLFLGILSDTFNVFSREPSKFSHGIYPVYNFSPALLPEFYYLGHSLWLGFLKLPKLCIVLRSGKEWPHYPYINLLEDYKGVITLHYQCLTELFV